MSNRGVHGDQSRVADDDCEGCSYCGLPFIRMHHEHDHAPIPKSMGGADMIPTCITCHDLKDRVTFPHWPAFEAVRAVQELLDMGLITDQDKPECLPDRWLDMSRWARIAWAKIARASWLDTAQGGREWYASTVRAVEQRA